MSWRDDPATPSYWIEIADLILARYPEWAPYILGPLRGHGIYDPDDERFFIEIPSQHPTIRTPLTIEVADREPRGMIDTYWNGHFEHNPRWRFTTGEHITQVLQRVDRWMSDEFVFELHLDSDTGRKAGTHRRVPDGRLMPIESLRVVRWSWRGTHDQTVGP